jgi:predicted signal transduction protein with EAL and GGDEF domain
VRAVDTLARIGGDEFVVLMNAVDQPEHCHVLADKLLAAIDEPLELEGNRLHIRTSIGMALYPQHGSDGKTLMKCADMAMYSAKAAGRNTARFFHPAMSEQAEQRMQMEIALREAIEQDQFQLHYQAKFDARSGHVVGYEALLRWRHPQWGPVPPDRFIPVAEDAGLIGAIGAMVIAKACAQLADWERQGFGWQTVAINVSVRQLEHDDLIGLISMELQRHGVPYPCLQVEVTESVLVAQPEQTLPVLRRLRELGVKVAIDDFGTGHSSLAYLYRLPVDVLKIDRTFVQHMGQDDSALAVVRTILSLSQTLHLQTVAEGVETEQQADLLRQAGCDVFQGYLFARPEPAANIEAGWVAQPVH